MAMNARAAEVSKELAAGSNMKMEVAYSSETLVSN
jgi:hypothetical protein